MKAEHWSDAVRAGLKKVSDWLLSSEIYLVIITRMLPWRVGSADLGFTYGHHVILAGVGSGSRTSLLNEYCVYLPRTIS